MLFRRIFNAFISSYSGISPRIWWLSLVMLINRTGTMVFPFLSIYLTRHLHFTEIQASWILSVYGLGSMAGTLFGGWFSDKYGKFKIQSISLILAGVGWLIISQVTDYFTLLTIVFFQTFVSESFRPANSAAIATIAKPENLTRSYSLNRMAINVGFTLGPMLAGVLASISYFFLFMTDGITSIFSGILFFIIFRKEFFTKPEPVVPPPAKKRLFTASGPLRDGNFMAFIICSVLFTTIFFQLLFTLPLYYKDVYAMSDRNVGLLLAISGGIVFLSEMVLVHFFRRFRIYPLVMIGCILIGTSFMMLNLFTGFQWLIAGMIIISYGEIFTMPFMMAYTSNKATESTRGRYMAFYSLAFSIGLILAPFIGMRVIKHYGYATLWWAVFLGSVILATGYYFILRNYNGTAAAETVAAPVLAE